MGKSKATDVASDPAEATTPVVVLEVEAAKEQLAILDQLAAQVPAADVPLAPLRKLLRDQLVPTSFDEGSEGGQPE